MFYRPSQLSKKCGISTDSLRHYERKGLLPQTRRSANGYREYRVECVARIQQIRAALALGFTLDELATLLKARDRGDFPCTEVRSLAARKLDEVEQQLQALTELRDDLSQVLQRMDQRLDAADGGPAHLLAALPQPHKRRLPGFPQKQARRIEMFAFFSTLVWLMPLMGEGKWQVETHGALRQIMHQGDISQKVSWPQLNADATLYGLGAATDLEGEIIILKGSPHLAHVVDNQVVQSSEFPKGATLLVTAKVAAWTRVVLNDPIADLAAMDALVANHAANLGIDTSQPFPFMLQTNSGTVAWHVIQWPKGDTEHSHAKHKAAAITGEITHQPIEILGFYSQHHQGVFTHHSSNSHCHVKSEAASGHVDELKLDAGAWLLLPKAED